jgi:RNA-binding protein YhbY
MKEQTYKIIAEKVHNFNLLLQAADRLPSRPRSQELNKLFRESLSNGHLQETISIAKLLNHNLSQKELVKLYKNSSSQKEKYEIVSMMSEPGRTRLRKKLRKEFVNNGILDLAQKTAQDLNSELTENELMIIFNDYLDSNWESKIDELICLLPEEQHVRLQNQVIDILIQKGNVSLVLEKTNAMGRKLTSEEINYLLNESIKNSNLEDAKKITSVINRTLTNSEIEQIYESAKSRGYAGLLPKIIDHLPEQKRETALEELLKIYINRGNFRDSQNIANSLNRSLTSDELEIIIVKAAENRNPLCYEDVVRELVE